MSTTWSAAVEAVRKRPPQALKSLVLNADGNPLSSFPLSLWPWQDAVTAVFRDRVEVLEEWDGAVIRSPSIEVPVPRVVMLRDYAPPPRGLPLNRLLLALRDRFCCQYCGKRYPLRDLTFDHVVPRARGGRSTWSNLVMACSGPSGCNSRKADALVNHSGRKGNRDGSWRPLKSPVCPDPIALQRIGLDFIPTELRGVFADWLPPATNKATDMTARDLRLRDGWLSEAYWTVPLEP